MSRQRDGKSIRIEIPPGDQLELNELPELFRKWKELFVHLFISKKILNSIQLMIKSFNLGHLSWKFPFPFPLGLGALRKNVDPCFGKDHLKGGAVLRLVWNDLRLLA